MKEQKLKRVTESDRRRITLAVSQNKRSRKWQEAKLDAQFGPHTCGHCRAEPCGALWPHGSCCHRCTHLPMPHWKLSHVLWYLQKPYYVMEVAARRPGGATPEEKRELEAEAKRDAPSLAERRGEQRTPRLPGTRVGTGVGGRGSGVGQIGIRNPKPQASSLSAVTDAVYYRWDGVCQWTRRARAHYFLGVRVSPVEFLRSLPNEEELAEYAPRERPPHPFESGVTEHSGDELGEPFTDRQESAPPEESTVGGSAGGKYYKKGLAFVEVEEADREELSDE